MAPWKSPRCSPSCWDEIKQHDAEHAKLVMALAHMTRDRDEWKHQHENLLAIYQASHLPDLPQTSGMRHALERAQKIIERDYPNGQLAIDIRDALAASSAPQALPALDVKSVCESTKDRRCIEVWLADPVTPADRAALTVALSRPEGK